jgi:hypothetical protein
LAEAKMILIVIRPHKWDGNDLASIVLFYFLLSKHRLLKIIAVGFSQRTNRKVSLALA